MVQVSNNILDNFWSCENDDAPAEMVDIRKIELFTGIKLPASYVAIMKLHDGGDITKDSFYYQNHDNEQFNGNIGKMFKVLNGYESILGDLLNPPEFFPEGLIPFADDGGGNLTCFDYRHCKENPPIVFWVHDDPEGEDVHFVSDNFEEFINMLHEPED